MRKDSTVELLEKLITKPARVRLPKDEPAVPGTSLFDDDVRMIVGEARLRHRVDLIRDEPPAAHGQAEKKPAEATRAAQEARSPADPISESEAEEEDLPEDSQVSSSRTSKLRLRLAKLAAQIARMEAQDAEQNGTKRNTIRENQQSPRSKGAQGAPRK